VADYGGVGHRAVGIVEDNGEKVALIGIRDLRQGVDVAVEAGVLGGFRGHAATVSARSASTPRSKRAPARTKATRWGTLTARQRSWADSMSLNVMASAAARDPAPG